MGMNVKTLKGFEKLSSATSSTLAWAQEVKKKLAMEDTWVEPMVWGTLEWEMVWSQLSTALLLSWDKGEDTQPPAGYAELLCVQFTPGLCWGLCDAMPSQRFLCAMAPQPLGGHTGPVLLCLLLATLVSGDPSCRRCPVSPQDHCCRNTRLCTCKGQSLDIWLNSSSTRFDLCKCNASICCMAYTFSKKIPLNYTNDFQGQAIMKQGTFHAPEVSKGDHGSYRFFNIDHNTCLLKVDIELSGAAAWPLCTMLLLLLGLVTSIVL
ncbi:hypothetical protein Y1Q_0018171 [Alligator mississippiensis]|uniref:Uncharacterized protein n=1 Tax=Alligator mississippiensis TaxID=8496 RepID=A0A151MRA3_ALLMI|nr:hypothetical protein Y1Q_0018171 [Alligator mississippiensis]